MNLSKKIVEGNFGLLPATKLMTLKELIKKQSNIDGETDISLGSKCDLIFMFEEK